MCIDHITDFYSFILDTTFAYQFCILCYISMCRDLDETGGVAWRENQQAYLFWASIHKNIMFSKLLEVKAVLIPLLTVWPNVENQPDSVSVSDVRCRVKRRLFQVWKMASSVIQYFSLVRWACYKIKMPPDSGTVPHPWPHESNCFKPELKKMKVQPKNFALYLYCCLSSCYETIVTLVWLPMSQLLTQRWHIVM